MPKDNIERAIAKGTGADSGAEAIEEVTYEGYGPGGVAIMVEALTDNRNRTGSEVRHIFTRHGGSLGEPGSVAWNFEKKGVAVVEADRYSEDDLMPAIDAGAEDVAVEGSSYQITTAPEDLVAVRGALEQAGVAVQSAEPTMVPRTTVPIEDEQIAKKVVRLVDSLEDLDDVQDVYANFDIPERVLETVAT
jgi:YebC/PmpR family DNA-binding regulatory protein